MDASSERKAFQAVFLRGVFSVGYHRIAATQLLCLRAATQIPRSAWIRQRTSFGLLAPEPSPYQPIVVASSFSS